MIQTTLNNHGGEGERLPPLSVPHSTPLTPSSPRKRVDLVSIKRYQELSSSGKKDADIQLVIRHVARNLSGGITAHELAQELGVHRQQYHPRLSELLEWGTLVKFHRKCFCRRCKGGRTCIAYKLKE